jgi:hypothetical protein
MIKHTTLGIALSAAVLGGCAGSTQARTTVSAANQRCSTLGDVSAQVSDLYANNVTSVKRVRETLFLARALQPEYTAGAEIFVLGEQGMNEAYLDRLMTCHASAGAAAAQPNDPLHVRGIERIDVNAAGSHFRVSVTSTDRSAGKAIWQRAEQLEGGSVEVRQLAASHASSERL